MMAGKLRTFTFNYCKSSHLQSFVRCLSTRSSLHNKDGWLNKLLVRKIEPTKESHSSLLSDKEIIYELQTHNIKPGQLDSYLKNYETYVKVVGGHGLSLEMCGSWTVGVGDQDQCLHLWRYEGGYSTVDNVRNHFSQDKEISKLITERNQFLRQRVNQYLLSFSFWPPVTERTGSNIYEIRSYFLKPGTMIEWGNNWARAIQFRQSNNEAYGGFFSQVGRLYNVHHIWSYGSLAKRKEAREGAWRKPGWDEVVMYTVPLLQEYESRFGSLLARKQSREDVWHNPGWDQVVAYTVPLIREMHTRILYPNSFSPSK